MSALTNEQELAAIRARLARANPRCAWTYIAVGGVPMECGYPKSVPYMHEDHEFTYRPGWATDAARLLDALDAAEARVRVAEDALRTITELRSVVQLRRVARAALRAEEGA